VLYATVADVPEGRHWRPDNRYYVWVRVAPSNLEYGGICRYPISYIELVNGVPTRVRMGAKRLGTVIPIDAGKPGGR